MKQWGGGSDHTGTATTLAPIPMRQVGQPAEVAALVCWLLSDEASYVTGGTFTIDSGRETQ